MNDEWATPPGLVTALEAYLDLNLRFDLAASDTSYKAPYYWAKEDNALEWDWQMAADVHQGDLWLNPPYSRDLIGPFMRKAAEAQIEGHRLLALVRFDPSAKWFQSYVDDVALEVLMLPRRVKFVGASAAYNFPVCAVLYSGSKVWSNRPTNYYIPDITWEQ